MTSRSPTSIDEMLLLIPVPVRAALKGEFHLQVKIAYTKHLNDELAAVQATVPQAVLPSLPPIVPEITPAKTEKPGPSSARQVKKIRFKKQILGPHFSRGKNIFA
jgi:hypothetical protein